MYMSSGQDPYKPWAVWGRLDNVQASYKPLPVWQGNIEILPCYAHIDDKTEPDENW